MRLPPNMTEKQVVDQIMVVVDRSSAKYTFHGYDIDDIKQEAFIICMDALERYDPSRPLENFLAVHLSNRLKNFIRDNYYTKDETDKKKILRPKYISNEDCIPSPIHDHDNIIDAQQAQDILDKHLPSDCRADYLKIINDVYVPKKRREEILATVKNLVERHTHEKG